jgi:hypothetical protein
VEIGFFPNAKDMSMAVYAFLAGVLVALCCGMRLIIRTFQFLEGAKPWNPWKRPSDPIIGLILGIKFRNTLVLELFGLAIAVPIIILRSIISQFLKFRGLESVGEKLLSTEKRGRGRPPAHATPKGSRSIVAQRQSGPCQVGGERQSSNHPAASSHLD